MSLIWQKNLTSTFISQYVETLLHSEGKESILLHETVIYLFFLIFEA